MKNFSILLLLGLFYAFTACSPEPISELEIENGSIEVEIEETKDALASKGGEDDIIKLVIMFTENVSNSMKPYLRQKYGVEEFEQCSCGDSSLELWIFERLPDSVLFAIEADPYINIDIDPDIDIKEKKRQLRSKTRLENIDLNAFLSQGDLLWAPTLENELNSKIVDKNDGVTIAVLDTGIDRNYEGFKSPFLYKNSTFGSVIIDNGHAEISGWDFVNGDNNPSDDNGHGTFVTYSITSTLTQHGIKQQILAVKIADKDGSASYFNLLCGFKYALSKPDMDIINLSLGWYGEPSWFLAQFIEEARQRDIVVVTSAGNNGTNNDEEHHYPSSYTHENIISITGMNQDMGNLAWYSNYGPASVDFAVPSERIPFNVRKDTHFVSGTSFACAYGTSYIASLLAQTVPPKNIKYYMASKAVRLKNLYGKTKYSAYIPYPVVPHNYDY